MRALVKSKRNVQSSGNRMSDAREKQFALVTVIFNALFFLTQLLLSLVQLSESQFIFGSNQQLAAKFDLFSTVAFMIADSFMACRFFLNKLHNRGFRYQVFPFFKHLITKRFWGVYISKIRPA